MVDTNINLRDQGRVTNAQDAIAPTDLPTLQQVSGLISGGGDLNASFVTLRLSSTVDASNGSTAHAFQIGPDGGTNLIIDGNEILARNGGSSSPLYLNLEGGLVRAGGDVQGLGNVYSSASGDDPMASTSDAGAGLDPEGRIRATATGPGNDPSLELYEASATANGGRIWYDTSADVFSIGTVQAGTVVSAIEISQGSTTVNIPGTLLIDGESPLLDQDLVDHESAADPHADYLLEADADTIYLAKTGGVVTGPISFTGSGAFLTPEYLGVTVNVTDPDAADALGGFSTRHVPTGSANQPDGIEHGLITLAKNTSYAVQIAGDYRTGDLYSRGQDNGAWGPWLEIGDAAAISSAIDAHVALPDPHSQYLLPAEADLEYAPGDSTPIQGFDGALVGSIIPTFGHDPTDTSLTNRTFFLGGMDNEMFLWGSDGGTTVTTASTGTATAPSVADVRRLFDPDEDQFALELIPGGVAGGTITITIEQSTAPDLPVYDDIYWQAFALARGAYSALNCRIEMRARDSGIWHDQYNSTPNFNDVAWIAPYAAFNPGPGVEYPPNGIRFTFTMDDAATSRWLYEIGLYNPESRPAQYRFVTPGNAFDQSLTDPLYVNVTGDTMTGDLDLPRIRVTATNDAGLSSTLHGFQVGPTTGLNLVADDNEIMARNNGVASTLALNFEGGLVNVGTGGLLSSGNVTVGHSFINTSDTGVSLAADGSVIMANSANGTVAEIQLFEVSATKDGAAIRHDGSTNLIEYGSYNGDTWAKSFEYARGGQAVTFQSTVIANGVYTTLDNSAQMLRMTNAAVEAGGVTPHGLRVQTNATNNAIFFVPENEGSPTFTEEFGYSFITDQWFFEGPLTIGEGVAATDAITKGAVDTLLLDVNTDVSNHIGNSTDAHSASAISITPPGAIPAWFDNGVGVAYDVQTALNVIVGQVGAPSDELIEDLLGSMETYTGGIQLSGTGASAIINAGAITGTLIAGQTIVGSNILAGTLDATHISVGSLTGNLLNAETAIRVGASNEIVIQGGSLPLNTSIRAASGNPARAYEEYLASLIATYPAAEMLSLPLDGDFADRVDALAWYAPGPGLYSQGTDTGNTTNLGGWTIFPGERSAGTVHAQIEVDFTLPPISLQTESSTGRVATGTFAIIQATTGATQYDDVRVGIRCDDGAFYYTPVGYSLPPGRHTLRMRWEASDETLYAERLQDDGSWLEIGSNVLAGRTLFPASNAVFSGQVNSLHFRHVAHSVTTWIDHEVTTRLTEQNISSAPRNAVTITPDIGSNVTVISPDSFSVDSSKLIQGAGRWTFYEGQYNADPTLWTESRYDTASIPNMAYPREALAEAISFTDDIMDNPAWGRVVLAFVLHIPENFDEADLPVGLFSNGGSTNSHHLFLDSSYDLTFRGVVGPSSQECTFRLPGPGTYSIALRWSGKAIGNIARLYVNGNEMASFTNSYAYTNGTDDPVIGGNNSGANPTANDIDGTGVTISEWFFSNSVSLHDTEVDLPYRYHRGLFDGFASGDGFHIDASGRFSVGTSISWDGNRYFNVGDGLQWDDTIGTLVIGSSTSGSKIESGNYAYTSGEFSDTGTQMDLATGDTFSPQFSINNSSGKASFAGELVAPSGDIGGWEIAGSTLTSGDMTLDAGAGEITVNNTGRISVGDDSLKVDIVGGSTSSTTYIRSATADYGNVGTGFWVDAAGRFQVGNLSGEYIQFNGSVLEINTLSLQLDGPTGDLTVEGTVTASGGAIGSINIGSALTGGGAATGMYVGTGAFNDPLTQFYVDSAGYFSLEDQLSWNGTTLNISGNAVIDGSALVTGSIQGGSLSATTDITIGTGTYKVKAIGGAGTATYLGITSAAGNPVYNDANTPFYAGADQRVSIGDKLGYDSGVLTIDGGGFFSGDISAASGDFTGNLAGGTIDIGGADDTSFHVDVTGQMWLGDAAYGPAKFKVSAAGDVTAISGTVGGWTLGANDLTSGSVKLDAANELIRVGNDFPIVMDAGATSERTTLRIGGVGVYLDGTASNYITTTDKAALDIVGDIALVAHIRPDGLTPGTGQVILSKWDDTAGSQRGYMLRLEASGALRLYWSTDGVDTPTAGSTALLATVAADGDALWVGAALDVTTGDAKFWTSLDGITWTQLGTTVAGAGATSIFANTFEVKIGTRGATTSQSFIGSIYDARIYSGIGAFTAPTQGTLVAHWVGAGEDYNDGLGNVWTHTGGAWQWSPGGGSGIYADASGRFSIGSNLIWDPTTNDLSVEGTITTGSLTATGGSIAGLTIDPTKMYLGAGIHGGATTPFYVDNTGDFSLKDKFVWDQSADTLDVVGRITGTQFDLVQGADTVMSLYSSDTSFERLRMFTNDTTLNANEKWDIGWHSGDYDAFQSNAFFIKLNTADNPTESELLDALGITIRTNNLQGDAIFLRAAGNIADAYAGSTIAADRCALDFANGIPNSGKIELNAFNDAKVNVDIYGNGLVEIEAGTDLSLTANQLLVNSGTTTIAGTVNATNVNVSTNLDVNGAADIAGVLTQRNTISFTQANPSISASNYVVIPNGIYISNSAIPLYTEASVNARGGIKNDTGSFVINGGSNGITSLGGFQSSGSTSGSQSLRWNTTFGTLLRFTSSERYKEKIEPVGDVGSIIDQLRPVTFIMRHQYSKDNDGNDIIEEESDEDKWLRHNDITYGFIAEEVAEVADGKLSIWEPNEEGDGISPINWAEPDMIALLVREAQSLRKRVAELEGHVARMDELEARLDAAGL